MKRTLVFAVLALVLPTAFADAPYEGVLTRAERPLTFEDGDVGGVVTREAATLTLDGSDWTVLTDTAELRCVDGEPYYLKDGHGLVLNGSCSIAETEDGYAVSFEGQATGADLVLAGKPASAGVFRVEATGTFG